MKLLNTSEYDVIKILGLTATGRHGVYPSERRDGQPFSVDVIMHVDTRKAATDDDLSHTVDYSEVAADVASILSGPAVYLIETLAQRVAEAVLAYPAVQIVEVEVHKPNAPMHWQFNDVSMTIRRTRDEVENAKKSGSHVARHAVHATDEPIPTAESAPTAASSDEESDVDLTRSPVEEVRAVIALGANMGTPWKTLAQAVLELEDAPGVEICGVSGLFRTDPILAEGQAPQDDYFNAVVEVRTSLSPLGLLSVTSQIEDFYGRTREEHWGPRTLDLDIICYDGIRSNDEQLTLPHPRAHQRAFVLVPWSQIDPDATLGRYGRVDVLAEQVRDQDIVSVADVWVEDAASGVFPANWAPTPEHRDPETVQQESQERLIQTFLDQVPEEPAEQAPEPAESEPDSVPEPSGFEDAAETADSHTPPPPPKPSRRPLPKWKPRQPERIIDDASELHPIKEEPKPESRGRHRRRPRMESGLAEDFATGLIPMNHPPKPVSRRTILRPTVTGNIPVTRRETRDPDQ